MRLPQDFVWCAVPIALARLVAGSERYGCCLTRGEPDDEISAGVRREIKSPPLRRLAMDRYRTVRLVRSKTGLELYYWQGDGTEAIFPSGSASVVYMLDEEPDWSKPVLVHNSFVQRFRVQDGKVIEGTRVRLAFSNSPRSGHAANILSYLKMRSFHFPRGKASTRLTNS